MRSNKSLIITLIMLILVAAFYRIIPNRPMGFAPHLAMALFAGAIIKDRKWAIAFPILSMLISDLLYQWFYVNANAPIAGFYPGQIINYILFAGLTFAGSFMKRINVKNVVLFSLGVSVVFFLLSNFHVWITGWGFARPRTFQGLMLCYGDALPFFGYSVLSTLIFSGVLFGGWRLITAKQGFDSAIVRR